MNPPSRKGTPDVRRLLIDSAKHDAPSPRALRKARAAVLLAATAAATSTSVATAASTSVIRWAVILKWLGIGVVAGTATIGAVKLVSPNAQAPAQVPTAPTATMSVVASPLVSAPISNAPAATASQTARIETTPRSAVVSAPVESEPEPAPASSAPPAASSNPSLAEEVAVLDEARKAVAAGRGADALVALDRYQRDYPRGRLGHEAAFVRMQALILTGNRAAAQQLAEQFLRASPSSPLAPRVRELLR
ncbi:MAG: hypothetical protein HY898_14180 [Deltaproteobacteria bacterium]|nr:hypothetical protein [Deltaproteobacteria bacterium]